MSIRDTRKVNQIRARILAQKVIENYDSSCKSIDYQNQGVTHYMRTVSSQGNSWKLRVEVSHPTDIPIPSDISKPFPKESNLEVRLNQYGLGWNEQFKVTDGGIDGRATTIKDDRCGHDRNSNRGIFSFFENRRMDGDYGRLLDRVCNEPLLMR